MRRPTDSNPQRIGLWGTSAGGHLAAIAGLSPQHPQGGRERVSVDRAGVFDVARAFFAKHLR